MSEAPPTAGFKLLEDEAFVRAHVWPVLSSDGRSAFPRSFRVVFRRRRDPGRAVAEYRFGGDLRVIAKLYPDRAEGLAVHAIHSALWENGFGSGSPFRVPQPIAYLPEHRILLMPVAPGQSLRDVPLASWDRFKDGLVHAARWVAALHAWPRRQGPIANIADDFARLERLTVEASACRPDDAAFFRSASDELMARHASLGTSGPHVQTHGRYHLDHVFLAPECVTVVDLDRSAVGEAARDVGEFLHRLRWELARVRLGKPAMNEATDVFLAEYTRESNSDLSGLLYYWSASILFMLLRSACKPRPSGRRGDKRLRHLRREFDRIPPLIIRSTGLRGRD